MKKIVSMIILLFLIVSFSYGVSAQQSNDLSAQAEKKRQAILRDILMNLFNLSGNNVSVTPSPSSISPTVLPSSTPTQRSVTPNISNEVQSGVLQVDWVYAGQGICWSAWTVGGICTLSSHEGGILPPSMKDFNRDGVIDVECSEGDGSRHATTIKNISNSPITIDCQRYACRSCTSGNGTTAQCDGNIDSRALRVVDTITLTPGCTATCTINGASGTCIETTPTGTGTQPSPSVLPSPTPNFVSPTVTVVTTPVVTPTTLPTNQPQATPTPISDRDQACIPIEVNGSSSDKLDIVIYGGDYTPDLFPFFLVDAQRAVDELRRTNLTNYQSQILNKMNWYVFNNIKILGNKTLTKDDAQAIVATQTTCPQDRYLILVNKMYVGGVSRMGIGGAVGRGSFNNPNYLVSAHEWGHYVGFLSDEYDAGKYFTSNCTTQPSDSKPIRDPCPDDGISACTNENDPIYAEPCPAWDCSKKSCDTLQQQLYLGSGCYPRCGIVGAYRARPQSVMDRSFFSNVTDDTGKFNGPSLYNIIRKLESYN